MPARICRRSLWVVLPVALCLGLTQQIAAQKDNGGAPSTMSGVYTAAQAARGEETYMGICVACHPPGTYAGQPFKANWDKRPLSDLFDIVTETMPKQDPGTLTPKEVAQVI
ncbi:MAG TPA: cytochrome c, partial [Vicinamibacterales bacterium]|nr:cytochrome c [Vicinamibacterales bacterium]